jgi:hypothetical protein
MGSNNKLITFIGLFFLASISLHSFAHVSENLIEMKPQIECESCQSKDATHTPAVILLSGAKFIDMLDSSILRVEHFTNKQSYHSQAPPKI